MHSQLIMVSYVVRHSKWVLLAIKQLKFAEYPILRILIYNSLHLLHPAQLYHAISSAILPIPESDLSAMRQNNLFYNLQAPDLLFRLLLSALQATQRLFR